MAESRKRKFYNRPTECGGMTLEEVARVIGVSRERIRQIEKAAMRKMRKEFERRGITSRELR